MIAWQTPARRHSGPHAFTCKILNWSYCAHCGLVALRNDATRAAMRRPCEWFEDL